MTKTSRPTKPLRVVRRPKNVRSAVVAGQHEQRLVVDL